MTDSRKAQLEIAVDSTASERGFERIERAADKTTRSVASSAGVAAKGIDGIGNAANTGAQKLDKATKSMIPKIQRVTAEMEAGEKGTVKYFEAMSRLKGANVGLLRPYLDQLDAAKAKQDAAAGSLNKMGVSAAQTAAAMRGVPAQFTDIITSLQGGQNPMTVLLQQGGQLKDMFGGVGNAARALGGYVAGLVTPFTAMGAAVAGVGVLWYQAEKEAREYSKALILSGNAAGTTSGQMQIMAQGIASISGTQGAAAEALAIFAQNSKVGRSNLEEFTGAALRFSEVTGQSVDAVAKQFADLAKDPLEASLKLNDGMNYLTVSTYNQIKALTEQGRATEAAYLAQKTYSDHLNNVTPELVKNIGYIEHKWNAVAKAVKSAWDWMKDIGRDSTEKQIDVIRAEILRREAGAKNMYAGSMLGSQNAKELQALRDRESILQSEIRLSQKSAEMKAAEVEKTKARVEADKDGLKYLSERQRMERDIAQQTETLTRAGASRVEIEQRIAQIKSSYAQKNIGDQNEVADIRAKIDASKEYIARLSDMSVLTPQLTDAEKQSMKIQRELEGAITGTARAMKEQALAASQQLIGLERVQGALEDARGIYQKALAQEAANAVLGKGTTAVEAYTLAEFKRQAAEAQASGKSTPEYIAALEQKISAQERYVAALNAADFKTLNAGLDEWMRSSREADKLYSNEAQLVGMTSLERAKIVAQRQVELQLAKEISKIEQSSLSESEKDRLRQKARDTATVASAAATAKAVQDEWTKVTDQINQSLTDSLMRGFESGKSFAKSFRDGIVNMFKTMVLRPVINFVMAPISGSLASLMGYSGSANALGMSGASGGVGQGVQLMGIGNTISNVYSTVTSSFAALGDSVAFAAQDIGAWLVNNTTGVLNQAGSSMMSSAGSMGTAASYAGGAMAGYGLGKAISGEYTTALGKNTLEVIGTAIGSYFFGPFGAAIGGALGGAVNRAFGMGAKTNQDYGLRGTFSTTGADVQQFSRWHQKGGWFRSSRSGTDFSSVTSELDQFLDGALQMTANATKEYAKLVGLNADAINGFSKDINISLKGLDAAGQEKAIADAISSFGDDIAKQLLSTFKVAGGWFRSANFAKEGETASQTLGRLATSLSGVNDVLKTLGQTVLTASLPMADAASKLLDVFGGIEKYAGLAAQYLQDYYTEQERVSIGTRNVTEAVQKLGIGMPATVSEYRKLIESLDLTTEHGQKMYASLLQLAPAFAEVRRAQDQLNEAAERTAEAARQEAQAKIDALRASGKSISEWLTALKIGTTTGSASMAAARNQYLQTINLARANDQSALGSITGMADQYISAAKNQASTSAEFSAIVAQVSAEVSNLPAVKSYQQATLDALFEIQKSIGLVGSGITVEIKELAKSTVAEFSRLDKNLDGLLTFEELSKGLKGIATDEQIANLIKTVDVNGDGQLSALELVNAAVDTVGTYGEATTKNTAEALKTSAKQIEALVHMNNDGLVAISKNTAASLDYMATMRDLLRNIDASTAKTAANPVVVNQSGGGGGGGFIGKVASFFGFATGGVFAGQGIYNTPTPFMFNGDRLGVMGEAGPEAVMPLERMPDGALGVRALPSNVYARDDSAAIAALVAEINALRKDNAAQASALVGMQLRQAKLLERWDGNGLPETREVV